ncbi:hypothetical protein [Altererythrobacter lauratis]|uniref:Uncharacterized protein n=1 Tax=Alteraurantiacibacter lauratis TaxID=2054627 RepID=A0ABV7EE33_9SPHN
MTKVTPFLSKAKAKAEVEKHLSKGKTKAKDAKAPPSKQTQAAKIKERMKGKLRMSSPGYLARCRAIVGGDLAAAALLYRMAHLWRVIEPKWKGNDGECLAMQKADWATSAGLGPGEINTALKRLREYAFDIVTIKPEGIGAGKKLCVYFDPIAFAEALKTEGYEIKVLANEGLSVFN